MKIILHNSRDMIPILEGLIQKKLPYPIKWYMFNNLFQFGP